MRKCVVKLGEHMRTQASRFSLPQAHKGHREGNLTAYGYDTKVFTKLYYTLSHISVQSIRLYPPPGPAENKVLTRPVSYVTLAEFLRVNIGKCTFPTVTLKKARRSVKS